jgi:hypothetical protein
MVASDRALVMCLVYGAPGGGEGRWEPHPVTLQDLVLAYMNGTGGNRMRAIRIRKGHLEVPEGTAGHPAGKAVNRMAY